MKRRRICSVAVAGVLLLTVAACGSKKATGASTGGTKAAGETIKIGYLGDLTGVAASSFAGGFEAAQARVAMENEKGGVNGHKVELVSADTASTTAQTLIAAKHLVENEKVFGIITDSAFVFAASKYLQTKGIPVTGWGIDGPEWSQAPNANMFTANEPIQGPLDGKVYRPTYDGVLMKQLGVTKLATMAFKDSPSSVAQVKGTLLAAKQEGIAECYQNYAVPFGGVDFTAIALQIKNAGCDAVRTSFVSSSDLALVQTLKNAGVNLKVMLVGIYGEDVLAKGSANTSAQGAYGDNQINFTQPNSATQAMLDAVKRYDSKYKEGTIPGYGVWTSWVGTDLMISGLSKAGANPTQESFISGLRAVESYDASGVLATGVKFTNFGTAGMLPATPCQYYFKLEGDKFSAVNNGEKVCGKYIQS
jgi:branched-chain amino acid transport system substrate-binding protein